MFGSSEVVYVIRAFTGNTNSTSDPMRVRRNRRIADSRLCRPPRGRTKFSSPLTRTHTYHSSSGDLLLLSPGCPQLPEIQNTFVCTKVRSKISSYYTNEGIPAVLLQYYYDYQKVDPEISRSYVTLPRIHHLSMRL